jgi:hypothetical protein
MCWECLNKQFAVQASEFAVKLHKNSINLEEVIKRKNFNEISVKTAKTGGLINRIG